MLFWKIFRYTSLQFFAEGESGAWDGANPQPKCKSTQCDGIAGPHGDQRVSRPPSRSEHHRRSSRTSLACTRTSVAANVIRSAVPIFRTKSTADVAGLDLRRRGSEATWAAWEPPSVGERSEWSCSLGDFPEPAAAPLHSHFYLAGSFWPHAHSCSKACANHAGIIAGNAPRDRVRDHNERRRPGHHLCLRGARSRR